MISPWAADRIRKVVGYGLATLLTLLLFRVLGRLAAGRLGLDFELVALVVLSLLAILWVRAAKRVRSTTLRATPLAVPYRLTSAEATDAPWLEALRREVYQDLFVATWGGWDEARHQRHWAACLAEGHISIVETEGARVGMVQLFDEPDEVRIGELQIQPNAQRRGFGTAVLRDVVAAAHARHKPVRLRVGLHNEGALRLYERVGFRRASQTETHHHLECLP